MRHSSLNVLVQVLLMVDSLCTADSDGNDDDLGESDSLVDPKNILLLAGDPDCWILCSEIFGSDLNGCLSNPFPEGVASNTKGRPD